MLPFYRLFQVILVLSSSLLFGQTISVDVTEPMLVCSPATEKSGELCALPPRLTRKTDPVYPEAERKAKIEGPVDLSIVVGVDGRARDIQVTKSLNEDLDGEAMTAVRLWQFQPGTYLGKAVPTKVTVELNFRLGQPTDVTAGTSQPSGVTSPQEVQNLGASAADAYSRHDFATAAKLARQVAELSPRSRNAWNLLGMSLMELDQFDAAADALKKQIEVDPGSPFAYNNLGRVYARQRNYDLAIEQFHKQLAINPQDRYAHANLGMALYQQKKYADAEAELQKALEITPNNSGVLVALGECDLELGNRQKAVDEFSRASSAASSPTVWNNAAYQLAIHNVELDRAQKWAESAVEAESVGLREVSLEQVTPVQMNRARSLASYWDTLGWVYFVRGDYPGALAYLNAAWKLHRSAVVGDHLAQAYEKLGKRNDALQTYEMALASASSSNDADEKQLVSKLTQKLSDISGKTSDVTASIDAGKAELAKLQSISIPNKEKASGSSDFVLLAAAPNKIVDVRQVTGSADLKPMTEALRSAKLDVGLPPSSNVQIPRRGTMTCAGQSTCRFVLLSAPEAADVARREAGADTAAKVVESFGSQTLYNNPAMGIHMSLPEGWKLVSEQPASYNQAGMATFQKTGSLANIVVVRQHLEATPDLYSKIVEDYASKREDYNRSSSSPIVRDGIQGERWTISWKESSGIKYQAVMEIFSVDDDHYQVIAEAPAEVFPRYAQNFDQALRSAQFPVLHVSAKDVLPQSH